MLNGIVECDESFIGGNPKNMHKARKAKLRPQSKVLSASITKLRFSEPYNVMATCAWKFAREATTREVLHAFINAKLADETELIVTDEYNQYDGIADDNTSHETVSHTQKEWVRGVVHTNGLEGVWSLFKRSIVGSYHQISVKHLDRYLDEFEFRFNNRENSFLFRDTLLRLLNSTNLEYKNLIAEDDEASHIIDCFLPISTSLRPILSPLPLHHSHSARLSNRLTHPRYLIYVPTNPVI